MREREGLFCEFWLGGGGGGWGVYPVRWQEWYFVIDHCFVAVRQKVKRGKAVRKIENHLILRVGGKTEFN